MTRTSTLMGLLPPTRSMICSPSTRRSFTCTLASISPISSRNRVPPSASSKRPMRFSIAPVKEPFSCPNSSLSSTVGASAAQCTVTSFAFGRPLRLWIACATSSLPVPLSPSISTVARVGATCSMTSNTCFMTSLCPRMPSTAYLRSTCCFSSTFSFSSVRPLSARLMRISSSSRLSGLVTKSYAPRFIASTAVSTQP